MKKYLRGILIVVMLLFSWSTQAQDPVCPPLTYGDLPYFEDFEIYGYGYHIWDISPCWYKGTVPQIDGLNRPNPARNEVEGDTVGLSFSNSSYFYCWAALPRLDDSVNVSNIEITFLVTRPAAVSSTGGVVSRLVVGVATDLNVDSTFVPVDTIDISGERLGSIHNVAVRFDSYTGDGKYIVFIAPSTDGDYSGNSIIIDNVTLRQAAPCTTPQRVRVTSTTANDVYATWHDESNVDSWAVYVGTPGFSIDVATPHIVYTNNVYIGSLASDTEYELVVVASCGGNVGYSSYPVHFHTLCAPIDSLPFVEDFENAEGYPYTSSVGVNNLPHCWLYHNTAGSLQYRGYPIVCSDSAAALSGSNAMIFCTHSQGPTDLADQYAIMPIVNANQYPLSNLQVSFWARNYANAISYVVVGVMSDPFDTSTFVPVDTVQIWASPYQPYEHHIVGFANYDGPHGHMVLMAPISSQHIQASIDDIVIEEIPNRCPQITAIHVQATASAAHLTWDYSTNFGFPTSFEVNYRNVSDTALATVITTVPELLLTSLAPDSSYWVSVAAECSGLDGVADTLVFSTQTLPCISWDTVDLPVDTLVLGSPGTEINAITPINAGAPFSIVQHLFLSTEIPVTGPTMLNGIGFDYAYTEPYQAANCEIYLGHTTQTELSGSLTSYGQLVFSGTLYFPTEGWNYAQFNQGTFLYDGTSNLCVTIVNNRGGSAPTTRTFRHEITDNNMTSWSARPNRFTPYSAGTADLDKRSNTRLITGGQQAYCTGVATCMPPIVNVNSTANGDYRVTWVPGYHETSWNVDYRIFDIGNWVTAVSETDSTEYILPMSELEPGTLYEIRVTSNCGDTVLSSMDTITTPCVNLTIPFHYGFEGLPTNTNLERPVIPCWHQLNDATQYFGLPGITAGAHTGNRGLGFGVSTSSYHCNYQAIVFPPIDTVTDAINSLYINFWAHSWTREENPILYVGVMTDPDDIGTFIIVDSVFIDPTVTGWDRYEVSFDNYSGNGQYIAIRANRPSAWDWTATIDDITLSHEPVCRRVDNIRFRDVTTDSATVYWTRGGDEMAWELTIGDSIHYLTDTVYTLHGLESDTVYSVTIRAICGEGDTSNAWSASFHTPCYLLGTLPLINDFENEPYYQLPTTSYVEAFPSCWRRVNDIPSNNNTNGRPYIRNTGISGIHGNNSMYWDLTYEYNNFFVVLPPVDKSVYNTRDLYLMFYARTLSNSEQPASYIIGVMDHDSDTAHFVPVDTITPTYDVTLYTVSFANYSGTGNYIAIQGRRPIYDRELLLDDIVLTDHLCFPVSHLRASSTDTSVTLVWSPGASDSVAVNELSYTAILGNDTVHGITDTFYTFHSLANTTLYRYAVATECPTLNSIFQTGSIQTECPPLTMDDIPYLEDFESYAYGYDTTISPCWRRGSVPSTISSWPFATHLYIGQDTVGLSMGATPYYYRWAALPRLDSSIDITRLEVNFLIKLPNSGVLPLPSTRLIVGVAEDVTWYSGNLPAASMEPTAPSYSYTYSGLVPVDTIDLSDEPLNSLHDISVRFENYTGNGRYIVFYAPSPGSGMPNNGFYLDNITLRLSAGCPTPQNVRVTRTTADSVYATWDVVGNPDSWLVYIGTPGFDIGNVQPHYVYGNSASIGGLAPFTNYELVIVASCGGNEGYPSYPVPFSTLCAPLTSLPFVEDFESVEGIPSYTTYTNVNTLPNCWQRYNTSIASSVSGAPLIHNDPEYAHGGNNTMLLITCGDSTQCSDQYAILPLTDPILYPAGGLQVSFWIRSAHYYYNSFVVVGVMSDPDDPTTFVAVDSIYTNASTTYTYHTVRMAGYRGPHGYVAFKAPMRTPGLNTSNRPYIDDIVLEEMPCAPAENLHVVHTGLDSLTLSWTDTSSASIFWYLEYDTVDFIPGSGAVTPILVTDTFYIMTGLDSATVYHIYLYPDCFDSVVSSHLVATTLLSSPSSMPYSGGFDSADSNGWVLINGNSNNRWMVGDATGNPVGSLYISDDGNSNHYSGATSTVYATRIFSLDTPSEYAYSYDWKCNGEDNRDFLRAALVPAQTVLTPDDYSGFDNVSAVPSGSIALDGGHVLSQHTIWQTQCGTFTIDTPGIYIWVFMWHNDDNIYNQTPAAIDNVNLVPNDCSMPQNVVWEISADSLSLTWTPVGEENIWEISLGDTSVIVTSPEYTFTNIPVSIIYTIRIRTICGFGDTSLAFTASIVNNRYEVTVTANNPSYGTVTGSGVYYNGDIATLSATPFTGYIFTQWSDGDITNPRGLVVTCDTSLTAIFEEEEDIWEIENSKMKIEIYPNPANGVTTVSITGISGKVNISVFDLLGREVLRETMECIGVCEKNLDIKGISDGTYFIRITSEETAPIEKKLIVR
ncbi:MAG: choice-of-anchor J domain-containing protein [Bacteroidales bacterium]|nr:choice-of-anchor J domain-containing protein [Bacteroidales bacterium]